MTPVTRAQLSIYRTFIPPRYSLERTTLSKPALIPSQGLLKEPNLAKEAGLGLLGMVTAYGRGDLGGVANSALGLLKRVAKGDSAQSKALKTKTSPADVIMWSGSKDTQKSYVYILSQTSSACGHGFLFLYVYGFNYKDAIKPAFACALYRVIVV